MKNKLDLSKGSPNRMYFVLGALAKNNNAMSQKQLAQETGFPISSVVDLIKKINKVYGMKIDNENGTYVIADWCPAYNPEEFVLLFEENK